MKRKFSLSWISSKQPRKQRKYKANAPLHLRHRFLSANLSKSLRDKHGKRSAPLRKGDEVLVMRGSFRKKKGKINSVDLKRLRVAIEGINRTKRDGSKSSVYFSPSALQIHSLNLDDKERLASFKKENSKLEEKKNAS
jgi:large subunit ribosomal protein L24